MAHVALSFVVVVWISGMLFGWLIEAKQLTILKGISNFFFLLYHLWYVYTFFTYAQVKYPLGFPLIMINIWMKEHIYLCILWVLFYINVFHKINKIYHKTLHCIFKNHYIKMKEVFFTKKKCSPVIIFSKKDHTKKKLCNTRANN